MISSSYYDLQFVGFAHRLVHCNPDHERRMAWYTAGWEVKVPRDLQDLNTQKYSANFVNCDLLGKL